MLDKPPVLDHPIFAEVNELRQIAHKLNLLAEEKLKDLNIELLIEQKKTELQC